MTGGDLETVLLGDLLKLKLLNGNKGINYVLSLITIDFPELGIFNKAVMRKLLSNPGAASREC